MNWKFFHVHLTISGAWGWYPNQYAKSNISGLLSQIDAYGIGLEKSTKSSCIRLIILLIMPTC